MADKFIVKVQQAMYSTEFDPPVIVHNKDHSVTEFLVNDGTHERKEFWYAELAENEVKLVEKLEQTDWPDW